ncbi:hypothetical protein [Desulfovibrio sp.]|uniref:hypothetical protein n=1 Tax=Desulfovibrio sp. TaxID=885 RepID=UPI0023CD7B4F|nr:hypothetical protein [Desulfovibrio sp.]MDE7241863.1 hypothetical protein [Desulfovibrio sp.]
MEYYADGHYLIHSGGIGWQDGHASEKLGAYLHIDPEKGTDITSITVEEKDGVVQYFMEVDGNFYRAEKLQSYHDGDNAPFGEAKLLGSLEITPTFDTIPELPEAGKIVDSWHKVNIEEDEDRFVFHGRFERGSLAMLLLDNGEEKKAYYINTTAVPYLAMCSDAFLEDDDREIKMNVSKRGIKGKNEVKLVIDDAIYDTGVSIMGEE